jgi:uncharacterized protein
MWLGLSCFGFAVTILVHALFGRKLTGLYWRGIRNAQNVQVDHNDITFTTLPRGFDGFTVLHIRDLHVGDE